MNIELARATDVNEIEALYGAVVDDLLANVNYPGMSLIHISMCIRDRQYTFDQIENINVFHNSRYTDILAKDISKASELLKLFYQLKAEQLYTIGDGENDICMLQCTDNSFTFNHVETVIKNSAQYHFDIIEQILAFINQK